MDTLFTSNTYYLCRMTLGVDGNLLMLTPDGQVLRIDVTSKEWSIHLETDLNAHSLVEEDDDKLILTNPFDSSIVEVDTEGQVNTLFQTYDGRPLIAPTSVVVNPTDGELVFTDAGVEGSSSFDNPCGALYRTIRDRTQLVPLCSQRLVRPSAVAVDLNGNIYVCEQGQNQVLRFVPNGNHYIGGVFYRFNGSMGPSGVCVSNDGVLFVSLQEKSTKGNSSVDGKVCVISPTGELKGSVLVPLCNLLDVALSQDGKTVYVLGFDEPSSTSKIFSVPL